MDNSQLSIIPLSAVDSEDYTYRITTGDCPDKLLRSIKTAGLISPPVLLPSDTDKFTVVCGFRRIEAYRLMGRAEISARILPPDTPPQVCAKLAITDNALQRPLNLIETSRAVCLLSRFYKEPAALAAAASDLGLPVNPSLLRKIGKLCLLPQAIQDGILSGTISLAMALELGELETSTNNQQPTSSNQQPTSSNQQPTSDIQQPTSDNQHPTTNIRQPTSVAFASLFESLKLSLNKQREVLTLIREIAIREDMSVSDVLAAEAIQNILNNEETDRNQKTRNLRLYLRRRRFPAITQAENAFESLVKDVDTGPNIRLIPPKDFEGTIYHLDLSFKNLAELKACQAKLEHIIQHSAFQKIVNSE